MSSNPRPVFPNSLAIARATSYGASPANQQSWSNGGPFFFLNATSIGILPVQNYDTATQMTGSREANVSAPTPGNRHAIGPVTGPVFPESLGALLMGALSNVDSVPTADAANPLGAEADLSGGSITVSNPTASAFLEFAITAAAGTAMSLVIAGDDANGRAVGETIPITLATGAVTVYSQYNYESGITVVASGFSSGVVNVDGYVQVVHTFSLNDEPSPYTGVNLGDPGRGVDEAGTYLGGVITSLDLVWDSDADASPLTFTVNWKSKVAAYAAAPTLYPPLSLPFSSANVAATIDGIQYKVVAGTMNIAPNNDTGWVSDGTPDPRFSASGKFTNTGKLTLLPIDGTQWGNYMDTDELPVVITVSNPRDLLSVGVPKTLVVNMPHTYFTAATESEIRGYQAIEVDYFSIAADGDGSILPVLTNGVLAY